MSKDMGHGGNYRGHRCKNHTNALFLKYVDIYY